MVSGHSLSKRNDLGIDKIFITYQDKISLTRQDEISLIYQDKIHLTYHNNNNNNKHLTLFFELAKFKNNRYAN
jgi:hypothetical protein